MNQKDTNKTSVDTETSKDSQDTSKKIRLKASFHEIISSILLLVCGAILSLTIINLYLGVSYGENMFSLSALLKEFKPFVEATNFVESSFYTDYDSNTLVDSSIKGYVSGLDDKFSRYESPDEFNKSQIQDAGQSIGIGIVVKPLEDGYIEIQEVNADTPADKSGLKVGDIIQSIDGNDIAELGYNESINLIKDGDDNTDIILGILRDNEILSITVTRTIIEVDTAIGQMLDNNIGYIQIKHFYTNTPDQFNAIYQDLVSQGAKAFIFDLRNNTGGYTTSVQGCLNDLLPKGDIAEATYNNGTTKTIIKSSSDETISVPSVIITNGMTASASEIFSSAMRELEGAILVGENTYGKGVMQVTQQLSNGGAVVLTVATYNIIGKECYHGVGLAPDYEITLSEDDTEDTQLNKAIEVANDLIK